jgi:hypothetical protein
MNCQDFNNMINELADYKPLPDALRDAGVSHAALCSSCAANLADARSVSSFLLQAARAENEAAPARVKANVIAAFASQVESQKSKVESQRQTEVQRPTSNVQRQRQLRLPDVGHWTLDVGRTRWFAAAAIAAVILLAVIFPILRRSSAPTSSPALVASSSNPSASTPGSPISNAVPTQVPKERSQAPVVSGKEIKRKALVRSHNGSATSAQAQTRKKNESNSGEYLPLTYLASGTAMESGTVVRVELSRSALASLGFTSGIDSSSDSVKAEVILGDDGVARAIRLVE